MLPAIMSNRVGENPHWTFPGSIRNQIHCGLIPLAATGNDCQMTEKSNQHFGSLLIHSA